MGCDHMPVAMSLEEARERASKARQGGAKKLVTEAMPE